VTIPWRRVIAGVVTVFAVSAAAVTVFEALAGKPVAAVVNNTKGSGYTFGGGSTETYSPPVTPSPTPSPDPPPSSYSPSPAPAYTYYTPSPTPASYYTPTPAVTPSPTVTPQV
jgi:hypothetical protein